MICSLLQYRESYGRDIVQTLGTASQVDIYRRMRLLLHHIGVTTFLGHVMNKVAERQRKLIWINKTCLFC